MVLTLSRVAVGLAGIASLTALFVLYQFDPAEGGYPACPLHELTGLHCPGCGTLRALHQLLHGNVGAALALDPLAVCMAPILFFGTVWTNRAKHLGPQAAPRPRRSSINWAWLIWILVIAFWILRNIPVYPFTLLAPH
jgi:hypothetical protein